MMQKSVTKNIKNETLGHDTYIYNNLPTNQVKATETAMYQVTTLIQEAVENRKLHLSFPRY
jgi:replication fork clamp-binding protein CrfC